MDYLARILEKKKKKDFEKEIRNKSAHGLNAAKIGVSIEELLKPPPPPPENLDPSFEGDMGIFGKKVYPAREILDIKQASFPNPFKTPESPVSPLLNKPKPILNSAKQDLTPTPTNTATLTPPTEEPKKKPLDLNPDSIGSQVENLIIAGGRAGTSAIIDESHSAFERYRQIQDEENAKKRAELKEQENQLRVDSNPKLNEFFEGLGYKPETLKDKARDGLEALYLKNFSKEVKEGLNPYQVESLKLRKEGLENSKADKIARRKADYYKTTKAHWDFELSLSNLEKRYEAIKNRLSGSQLGVKVSLNRLIQNNDPEVAEFLGAVTEVFNKSIKEQTGAQVNREEFVRKEKEIGLPKITGSSEQLEAFLGRSREQLKQEDVSLSTTYGEIHKQVRGNIYAIRGVDNETEAEALAEAEAEGEYLGDIELE